MLKRSEIAHMVRGSTASRWWWLLAVPLLTLPTGCSAFNAIRNNLSYNRNFDDAVNRYRVRAIAARAWHARKHNFANVEHLGDFAAGFQAGYSEVAQGGDGCTPGFPPRSYWGWQYQSPVGQAKVGAWFAGYPHGARAAEEDGIGEFRDFQLSHQLNKELRRPAAGTAVYESLEPVPAMPGPRVPLENQGEIIPPVL